MQSDTPKGEPQLQSLNPLPEVATGYVDPCIVYLETTASAVFKKRPQPVPA
jgi:hypothetical protein